MKFLELYIQNFLTIGKAKLALADTGLVVIQGKNEDEGSAHSNGAGKSSIPDALMWALFGETARGVSGDAVVNEKEKKNCYVELVIQDGDSIYRIGRMRKDSAHKNALFVKVWNPAETYPLGAPTDVTRGTEKETEALILTIMGCSKEVFLAAVYAGQEAMPDLPGMTDKQLKLLIEEAAGVERLERAYVKARDKVAAADGRASLARSTVAGNESQLVGLQGRFDALRAQHSDFEAGRKGRASSYTAAAADKGLLIQTLEANVAASGEAALVSRQTTISGALAEHSKVLVQGATLERAASDAQRVADAAGHTFITARTKVNELQEHIKAAPLNVGKPCRTCSKPHTQDDLAAVVANLTEQLKAAAKLAADLKATYAQAVDRAGRAKEKSAAFSATILDVTALTTEQSGIVRSLGQIATWRNDARLHSKDREQLVERANAAMTEVNPNTLALKTVAEQMVNLKKLTEAGKVKMTELEQDLLIEQQVAKVLSPAGVRAHILDTVTPFLNERTAEYLSALSDGNITASWTTLATTAKGELKEKFCIEVENATGAKSYKGLSGGEKRKTRLATVLALQDLVASRAVKPIDLWMGDEIDDALDTAGLERLMGILEGKARERGSVLVISHNELTDWADQVAVVTKRGGFATVEGALVAV